jgi:DNA-binding HxlR family transcriptional regulator
MLTLQLRKLEADRVITRTVYAEVPPRVEYCLTELGKTLEPVLLNLRGWGEKEEKHARIRALLTNWGIWCCTDGLIEG